MNDLFDFLLVGIVVTAFRMMMISMTMILTTKTSTIRSVWHTLDHQFIVTHVSFHVFSLIFIMFYIIFCAIMFNYSSCNPLF